VLQNLGKDKFPPQSFEQVGTRIAKVLEKVRTGLRLEDASKLCCRLIMSLKIDEYIESHCRVPHIWVNRAFLFTSYLFQPIALLEAAISERVIG